MQRLKLLCEKKMLDVVSVAFDKFIWALSIWLQSSNASVRIVSWRPFR
jgi:hypothetical protein